MLQMCPNTILNIILVTRVADAEPAARPVSRFGISCLYAERVCISVTRAASVWSRLAKAVARNQSDGGVRFERRPKCLGSFLHLRSFTALSVQLHKTE